MEAVHNKVQLAKPQASSGRNEYFVGRPLSHEVGPQGATKCNDRPAWVSLELGHELISPENQLWNYAFQLFFRSEENGYNTSQGCAGTEVSIVHLNL